MSVDVEANPYERTWEEAPRALVTPTIIVSSKAGYGDPGPEWIPNRTAPWRGISKRAEAAGWTIRFTYALAHWPEQFHGNGNPKKQAHYVHSIALRVRRELRTGFAVWTCEAPDIGMPPGGWSYCVGFIGPTALSIAAFKAAL